MKRLKNQSYCKLCWLFFAASVIYNFQTNPARPYPSKPRPTKTHRTKYLNTFRHLKDTLTFETFTF
ncbi:hypothetical protein SAMN04487894_11363 [Niabella drilacis]|uniref:Transposase n=1 Tax=Niabella drilacis (strain DSM 25811 / CCM 8410 / CCUG 62505 / LMG 26954 / E90) TaxID=1285928 RepID=A0A1G6XIP7_NIADE|nr:hypothetical protein SAMN04487894_11363 [Niabella drilacis]